MGWWAILSCGCHDDGWDGNYVDNGDCEAGVAMAMNDNGDVDVGDSDDNGEDSYALLYRYTYSPYAHTQIIGVTISTHTCAPPSHTPHMPVRPRLALTSQHVQHLVALVVFFCFFVGRLFVNWVQTNSK